MSRNRPRILGEYQPLVWDYSGEPSAHYVNGHVTDEEFRRAIRVYFGNTLTVPPDAKIVQVYVRNVRSSSSDFEYEWIQCAKGRGAFAMTVWNVEPHRGARISDEPARTTETPGGKP